MMDWEIPRHVFMHMDPDLREWIEQALHELVEDAIRELRNDDRVNMDNFELGMLHGHLYGASHLIESSEHAIGGLRQLALLHSESLKRKDGEKCNCTWCKTGVAVGAKAKEKA